MKKMWKSLFGFCIFLSFIATAENVKLESSTALELKACHVEGIREQVKCAKLTVPENYQESTKSTVDVNVVVLPALDNTELKTPLMFLAGGPGQAAAQMAGPILGMFREIRKTRDIVLVDQRGTGESNPLQCENFEDLDPYEYVIEEMSKQDIDDCIAQFNVDLSQYTSTNAIRDFEQVRIALGVEKINLYGGSYGTRAALIYMNMFPQSIETVVLDSVGPVEVPIGLFGLSAARSFNLLMENCQLDESCQKAFPKLDKEFEQLIQRLENEPVRLNIMHPTLGTQTPFVVTRSKLINTLRMQLYSMGSRQLVPLVINQAYLGNYRPLAGLISQMTLENSGALHAGLLFNIVCNEDIPLVKQGALALDADNNFGQGNSHLSWNMACPFWPKYSPESEFFKPVTANIPTLILSGNLDPVTPPSNGEYSDKSLPNSKHIVVKNASHIVVTSPCAIDLVNEFLTHKDPQSVDEQCLTEIADETFMTSLNGNI